MKTTILHAVISILTITGLNSQNFEWVNSMGGRGGADNGVTITTDALGNVYTSGNLKGTVDFDPGPDVYELTAQGIQDIYIQKLDSNGSFVWAIHFGGSNTCNPKAIKTDVSGYIYVTGVFEDTVDFDPGIGIYELSSQGVEDIFIQKLDIDGNFYWAKSMGGIDSDCGFSINSDTSGNVYTTGYFRGIVDFDPSTDTYELTSNGGLDVFIQKLDAEGNLIWARSFGGSSYDIGTFISTDNLGNVYTTGHYYDTVDFNPGEGTYELTSNGGIDIFIQKLDLNGNFLWAKSMGGPLTDKCYSISLDELGNLYTTGYFASTVDFDPGEEIYELTANGGADVFIQKLDTDGNFIWANNFGGIGEDRAYSINTDISGNLYTTGTYHNSVDFDPGVGIYEMTSNGGTDNFIQKLDIDGNFLWAKSFGGSSNDYSRSITTDNSGGIYITGHFTDTVDFDPGSGTYELTTTGAADIFIHKFNTDGNFQWVKIIDGPETVNGYGITVDTYGNLYTTGCFEGIVDFDPGAETYELTSNSGLDIFIQKSDADGNFLWAKSFGGSGNDYGYSPITDNSGNIYITGRFEDTVDFDPGTGIYELTSNGITDIFIQKLDTNGNFLWAKSMGGVNDDRGHSISLDIYENIYTTGYFEDTVDFDPGTGIFEMTADGYFHDIFIQKLDTNGDFIWAKRMGGFYWDLGYSIITDASGNVYTTGYFDDIVDFDPGEGTYELTSNGGIDIFIQKLDLNGNFLWAKSMGGPLTDKCYSISLDELGNLYTTGYFASTVDFDPGEEIYELTANGGGDVFIQKLDMDGDFQWAKNFGGYSNDIGWQITTDVFGNVYTTGYFYDTVDFDPGEGTYELSSNGDIDIFIHKLDVDGNFLWANNFGGSDGDIGRFLRLDDSGNIYTTGTFRETVDFDSGVGDYELTSKGNSDVFVLKLSSTLGVFEEQLIENLDIYPNPTYDEINISIENETIEKVQLFTFSGIKVIEKKFNNLDISKLSAGMYFVKVATESGKNATGKVIKF